MKILMAAVLAALVFPSCAPSTPQARIEREPEKFAALGQRDQSLVQQGKLARGMSPDAVTLAWGVPDQRFEGSKNSKHSERWDYAASRPVYSTPYFGGFGYGYGGSGPYGRGSYSGFALGPEVAYVPYRFASVWFVSGRVDSWERSR